jgi:hypothetical protein
MSDPLRKFRLNLNCIPSYLNLSITHDPTFLIISQAL